jgi:GT2 family glycosyltransferase
LGNTFYLATSQKDKIIRASTYGQTPIQTLPGSTMKRDLFKIVGVFLEDVRAGEDAEWMYRTRLHKIKSSKNDKIILYQHLLGMSYSFIIKKWFRNYSFSRRLSYLSNNKESYYISFSVMLILIAFNWNPIMTDWGNEGYEENLTYIPHVTKITLLIIFLSYFILRGIYLPIKKKVSSNFYFQLLYLK